MLCEVVADYAWPNPGEGVPYVAIYTCPACSRSHTVGWARSADEHPGVQASTCRDRNGRVRVFDVLGPPRSRLLEGPPVAEWRREFEERRRKSLGGRPPEKPSAPGKQAEGARTGSTPDHPNKSHQEVLSCPA